MKKTKIAKVLSVIMCVIITITGMCIPASAAVKGSTMDNAITVSFGKSYSKSWDKKTLKVNCFNKIKLTDRGILTISASKPTDEKGINKKLSFILYDSNGELVWTNGTSNSSNNINSKYKKSVGLDKGTYYLNIKPDYVYTSSPIKTSYSFSFKKTNNCEIESNNTTYDATELEIGKMCTAYFGTDGTNDSKFDFFKFKAKKNCFYTIQFDDYEKISGTTTIVDLLNKSGDELRKFEIILNSGKTALAFKAPSDGVYYIKIYNYRKEQFKYKIGVARYSTKPDAPIVDNVSVWDYLGEIGIYLDDDYCEDIEDLTSGFQISYSKNSDFENAVSKKVSIHDYHSVAIKSPKGTYFIRVRAYRKVEGKTVYGAWSDVYMATF